MHQYKIEVYSYNANGSMGKLYTVKYADNPETAERIMDDYKNVMQTDDEGNPTFKAYDVRLYCIAYKRIQNPTDFFANFKA